MNHLNEEEVEYAQMTATMFARLASSVDEEQLRRYIETVRPQMDGTLDAIIPHFMAIGDMRKAQHNLQFIVGVLNAILTVKGLVEQEIKQNVK